MVVRRSVLKGLFATAAGFIACKPALASLSRISEPSERRGIYSVQKLYVAVAIDSESELCVSAAKARALKMLSKETSEWFEPFNSEQPSVRIDDIQFGFFLGKKRLRKCVVVSKRYWVHDSYMSHSSQSETDAFKISVERSRR